MSDSENSGHAAAVQARLGVGNKSRELSWMLSPEGVFGQEGQAWAGRGKPTDHILNP